MVVMNQFNNLRFWESVWKSCTKIDSKAVGIICNSIIRTRLASYRLGRGPEGNEFSPLQFSLWSPIYRRISMLSNGTHWIP